MPNHKGTNGKCQAFINLIVVRVMLLLRPDSASTASWSRDLVDRRIKLSLVGELALVGIRGACAAAAASLLRVHTAEEGVARGSDRNHDDDCASNLPCCLGLLLLLVLLGILQLECLLDAHSGVGF